MATKKKASSKKLKMAWRPVPSAEEAELQAKLMAAQEHITKQDTMISELQMERNEAKAGYAKLKQDVELATIAVYGHATAVSGTPSINLDSIKQHHRDTVKELNAWKEQAQQQSSELYHLRQASKAAGTLADNVNALLKVLNAKGGK